jgi:hypothetical protein
MTNLLKTSLKSPLKASKKLLLITLILSQTFIATQANAGSNQKAQETFSADQVATFAKSVEKYAAKQGARAFIIARVGRPQSELPQGIKFTHTAIAVYSSIQLANGEIAKGYAIHNLYQTTDKADKSTLIVDYPVDFFWGVHDLKAGIIIPDEALEQRIIETIASGKDKTLHNPNYSVIANPFNAKKQNCTEYTLDVINAAIYQTTDIAKLKRNAKAHFSPQRVKTNPLTLMLGSLFMDDVTTSDHKGKVYTATFTTIGQYLQKNELANQMVIFNENGSTEVI